MVEASRNRINDDAEATARESIEEEIKAQLGRGFGMPAWLKFSALLATALLGILSIGAVKSSSDYFTETGITQSSVSTWISLKGGSVCRVLGTFGGATIGGATSRPTVAAETKHPLEGLVAFPLLMVSSTCSRFSWSCGPFSQASVRPSRRGELARVTLDAG